MAKTAVARIFEGVVDSSDAVPAAATRDPLPGRWGRAAAILALLGATLGVSLDAMHVYTGTTAYTNPVFWGLAPWVAPLFASAGVLFGLARPVWERILGWHYPVPSAGSAALGLALFVSAYLCSGILPLSPLGTSAVLAVHAALAWALCDRTLLGVLLAVSAAIFGTAFEVAIIHLDFFRYERPDFAGVAMWLPLLYLTVGITVGNFGKRLVER